MQIFLLTGLIAFFAQVLCFADIMFELANKQGRSLEEVAAAGRTKTKYTRDSFNRLQQLISTTGAHAFVPPSSTDLRGPCPGLNALANHNYLPHNGVATITQYAQVTNQVFGLGLDASTILAVLGAVLDGNLTSWSMGGAPPSGLLGGLLGTPGLLGIPQGLDGSHNKYETDVSGTRGDLYQYGNNYRLVMSQFVELFNMQSDASTANYNLSVLTAFRASRFNQSVMNNPYFFKSPISGILGQTAAYAFVWRLMANHTAAHPEGFLDQEVLKTFFAITGDVPNFSYKEGWERIPDNWYRRSHADEYDLIFFASDVVGMALEHPEFLSVGGNTGTVNSFVGVDLSDLTGGVYNAQNLLHGNNALCFAFQSLSIISPDLLKGLFSNVSSALNQLLGAIANAISGLGCPQLTTLDTSTFSQFPGYNKLNANGQYS